MTCYKDKTFCSFYEKCNVGRNCPSALIEEVRQGAEKWWESFGIKGTAPIMQYYSEPFCFKEKERE